MYPYLQRARRIVRRLAALARGRGLVQNPGPEKRRPRRQRRPAACPGKPPQVRICYLINGLNGGGASFPMIDVIQLMRSRGHQVKVLALMKQDGRAIERLEQAGIEFRIIGGGLRDVIGSGSRLVADLRRERPDVLWTSLARATIFGQLAAALFGIPVVSWQHSDYLKPAKRAILRRTGRLTQRWVADSEAVRRFTEIELGVPADRIDIWPLFAADPDAPQAGAWNGDGPFRIGTLGRLHYNKQYDVLIRAAARLRELDPALAQRVELVFGGDGPEAEPLRTLGAELGIVDTLRFDGFVSPGPFLAGLHCYIQTSRKEGLCVAAHEAMQAGLPVISTSVGEIAHSVLPGETGWLTEVGDVEALAQAMLAAARDPQRTAQMGIASRERVLQRFGRERQHNAGNAILSRIEADHGRGR
jgi:glycosyltransferase involved in cell wall biosynthesis